MFTVLFIGDQHFKTDNIPEVELFIEKITELANSLKPDLIILAGDLLNDHERLHTTPLNKAYEFIDKMRNISLTYILVGNHDLQNNQQFLTENHWLNGVKEWKNIIVIDKVISKIVNDSLYVFVPYVAPGRFEEALNTTTLDWKNAKCIFAHQEFFGCKMGAISSIEGDKWPLNYPEIVSGHIHSKHHPQKNIYYPGSAMQHAFGESSQNIIAYLTFDKNDGYKLDEIDLKLPRKKIVYLDVESIDEYKIPIDTTDKIKITLSGNYEQFKALKKTKKYKKIIEDGIKVVFKAKKNSYLLDKKIDGTSSDVSSSSDVPSEVSFSSVLHNLVFNQKDDYLYKTYELVIN